MRQGTTFEGGGGNDVLRGGRGNDILNGGPGSDRMYGGGGADQFYFSGNDLGQHPSVDVVYDLSFAGGDVLVFRDFRPGTFTDGRGADASGDGSGTIISSWAGLVHATRSSDWVRAGRATPFNENLIVRVSNDSGKVEQIVITGGWPAYVAAGGLGAPRMTGRLDMPAAGSGAGSGDPAMAWIAGQPDPGQFTAAQAFNTSQAVCGGPTDAAGDLCCSAILLGHMLFRRSCV